MCDVSDLAALKEMVQKVCLLQNRVDSFQVAELFDHKLDVLGEPYCIKPRVRFSSEQRRD